MVYLSVYFNLSDWKSYVFRNQLYIAYCGNFMKRFSRVGHFLVKEITGLYWKVGYLVNISTKKNIK